MVPKEVNKLEINAMQDQITTYHKNYQGIDQIFHSWRAFSKLQTIQKVLYGKLAKVLTKMTYHK